MTLPRDRAWRLIAGVITCCFTAPLFLVPPAAVAGDCSDASILLNAFDRDGDVERDLHAENLKVEVDRKQTPIASLSLDSEPRRIVLLVDSSGSMQPQQTRGWGMTIAAAAYAVDVIPPSASSELITFSDKLQHESSGFENRKLIGARVLDLAKREPRGRTSLFDTINETVQSGDLRFGDAIYLVTDGDDTQSKISLRKVNQDVISRGIRIFVFLVTNGFHTEEEVAGVSQMEAIAESTGGTFVAVLPEEVSGKGRARLNTLAPQIISQVEGVYRLELATPPLGKSASVKVSSVNRTRPSKIANISYSHQTVSCP